MHDRPCAHDRPCGCDAATLRFRVPRQPCAPPPGTKERRTLSDSDASRARVDDRVLLVDGEGMRFVFTESCALDVLFDGRRVWSIAAAEQERGNDGYRHVSWPDPLRQRLDGLALIELRDHVSGDVVAAAEASFGSGSGRVEIVDGQGRPVALTKYGRLNHPFESTNKAAVEGYLDQVEDVLRILRDTCHLPAFISYGTLLGAVRTGKLIGHDVDVDLGYLSAYDNPVDVIRETFRVERVLRDQGWRVVRENGGFLALFFPQSDGTLRNLDVFSCFIVNGMLHQPHDVRTPADRSAVLPLRSIDLEGRQLPAPACPEVFLESAYGTGWQTPDPSFEYHTPRATKRRIHGWLGGQRARRDYWSKFYNLYGDRIPAEPSLFAQWVVTREPATRLVEVGCGNARDAIFFADNGFEVTGIDFVPAIVNRAGRAAESRDVSVDFQTVNLYSLKESLTVGAVIAHQPGRKIVYARFLLHTLTDVGRENFWRVTRMALSAGGRCYLEFRTRRDASLPKAFGPSFRRFLNPQTVIAEAVSQGAAVIYHEAGQDLAPFEDENPHVCRLVLEW